MDIIDRINLIIKAEQLGRDDLCRLTGINYTRWSNVLQGKAKVRHEEVEALGKALPKYMLWLAYGVVNDGVEQVIPEPVQSFPE